jgi:hypothetical protein
VLEQRIRALEAGVGAERQDLVDQLQAAERALDECVYLSGSVSAFTMRQRGSCQESYLSTCPAIAALFACPLHHLCLCLVTLKLCCQCTMHCKQHDCRSGTNELQAEATGRERPERRGVPSRARPSDARAQSTAARSQTRTRSCHQTPHCWRCAADSDAGPVLQEH